MKRLNRYLLITTASLSTNPRLVKELSLVAKKEKVKVIAFNIGGWTVTFYLTSSPFGIIILEISA